MAVWNPIKYHIWIIFSRNDCNTCGVKSNKKCTHTIITRMEIDMRLSDRCYAMLYYAQQVTSIYFSILHLAIMSNLRVCNIVEFALNRAILLHSIRISASTSKLLIIQPKMVRICVSVCVFKYCAFSWYRKYRWKAVSNHCFRSNAHQFDEFKKIHLRWWISMALKFQLHLLFSCHSQLSLFSGCQLAHDHDANDYRLSMIDLYGTRVYFDLRIWVLPSVEVCRRQS